MEKNWKIKVSSINPSPTAALVVALLALVAGLSTPAQAAIERLANGSVGTAQLKNGAVTSPKLHAGAVGTPKLGYGAVTSPKIRNGTVTLGDLSAAARPKLPRSIFAANDWKSLTWGDGVQVARLDLPAGRWFVLVKGAATVSSGHAMCTLSRGIDTTDTTAFGGGPTWAYDSISLLAPKVAGGEAVSVTCFGNEDSSVYNVVISAVEVR